MDVKNHKVLGTKVESSKAPELTVYDYKKFPLPIEALQQSKQTSRHHIPKVLWIFLATLHNIPP
jgi:hypothetical protein